MKDIRNFLLNMIYHSPYIKENTTFKEHIGMVRWIKNMSENKLNFLIENNNTTIKAQRYGAGKKALSLGFAVASIALPGGIAIQAASTYLLNSYNSECELKCQRDESLNSALKSVCSNRCKSNALGMLLKTLNSEIRKCDSTSDPIKCRMKLEKIIKDYSMRKVKMDARLSLSIRKAKMSGHM